MASSFNIPSLLFSFWVHCTSCTFNSQAYNTVVASPGRRVATVGEESDTYTYHKTPTLHDFHPLLVWPTCLNLAPSGFSHICDLEILTPARGYRLSATGSEEDTRELAGAIKSFSKRDATADTGVFSRRNRGWDVFRAMQSSSVFGNKDQQ
ncbi:hypothetical protein DFH09DRAFT_1078642 [Mycena vulgaris]|nr:hypothetical protein DFH09DRAFT_1078642 [Mycena vulgaris]